MPDTTTARVDTHPFIKSVHGVRPCERCWSLRHLLHAACRVQVGTSATSGIRTRVARRLTSHLRTQDRRPPLSKRVGNRSRRTSKFRLKIRTATRSSCLNSRD